MVTDGTADGAGSPASPPKPQPVLGGLTSAAIFLIVTVDPGGEAAARDLLGRLGGITRSVGFAFPEDRVSCVVGIGSRLWDRLFDGPRPALLHEFRELNGARHRAVSTPGDLLFHIRAMRADLCFSVAQQIMARLRGAVTLVDEVQGFRYYDARDLLGFVDGTENPVDGEAAEVALIGAEDPRFAGGSYVIVQKYLHDLAAWDALPVEAQERVIGRTKLADIEFDDEVKPDDSHVAMNTLEGPDGGERQILRDNMPFGSAGRGEFGTYFIAYAADPGTTEEMLRNMFLGRGASSHDRILDFSTAVTGSLFYVPSADFLDAPPDAPPAGAVSAAASNEITSNEITSNEITSNEISADKMAGGKAEPGGVAASALDRHASRETSLGIGDLRSAPTS
ncbi:MAG: Dyp-type peroxidase [Actinocrinis sp.]